MKHRTAITLLIVGLSFSLVVLAGYVSLTARGFDNPFGASRSDHLLLVGIDSWSGYPNGLPDMLLIFDLDSGEMRSIPRSTNLGKPSELDLGELGDAFCQEFCTVQNVYSAAAAGNAYSNGISRKGVLAATDALASHENLDSLSFIAFDLIYARSLLNRLGEVELKDFPSVWVGPTMQGEKIAESGYQLDETKAILAGDDLYWFARSRHQSSEDDRSLRQELVIRAILEQKNLFEITSAALTAKGEMHTNLAVAQLLDFARQLPAPGVE